MNEPDGARPVEIALDPERRPAEIDEERRAGEPALVLLEAPIRVEEEDGVRTAGEEDGAVAVDAEALRDVSNRDERTAQRLCLQAPSRVSAARSSSLTATAAIATSTSAA